MINLNEMRSVTEFQRNVKVYVGRLKKKKSPLVLTLNGRAAVVVQDAQSYQTLLDKLEAVEIALGLRESFAQFERGEGRPARIALEELKAKHGLSH